jgi:hypothetical protein
MVADPDPNVQKMDEASELQFISLLNKVAAWPEVILAISFVFLLIPWLRIRIPFFFNKIVSKNL